MKKFYQLYISIVIIVVAAPGLAKELIEIPLLTEAAKIDGRLDEEVWKRAAMFTSFKTFKPDYGKTGSEKTVAYLYSDHHNFYFAAKCYQKNAGEIKASVTKRDNMFGDDWIAFCIDTFSDKQRAYGFLVNPFGIQGDGMLNHDGNLDGSHDMIWFSKGQIDKDGYSVEIKIPFKSIRFPLKKQVTMGIWLVRQIVKTSENMSFPALSPNRGATLSQMKTIRVREMKYNRVIELLPALTHSRVRQHHEGEWTPDEKKTELSLTGKVGLTPSLTLDATINPDFSQVEADAGQIDINLRHAIYYQEKRPFFLEGMEYFNFAGNTEDAPLYSVVHTRNIVNPVFGLKLTGNIGSRNSLAVIYAKDRKLLNGNNDEDGSRYSHFGILRLKHSLKKDNYIGSFVTMNELDNGHNRIAGVDGRFRLSGLSKFEYHLLGSSTATKGNNEGQTGHAAAIRYSYETRKTILDIGLQDISPNFQVNSGFLTRRGLTRLGAFGMVKIYPKSTFFQRIEPFYWSFHILDRESNMMESFNLFTLRFQLPRSSQFRIDFMLANEVFSGERFSRNGIGCQFNSHITKQLFLHLFFRHSGAIFYDPDNPFGGKANRASISAEYQPFEKLNSSLDISYSDFKRSSDGQMEYNYTIIRNRTTFQLNKYLFFRGIAEYNVYHKKLNIDLLASFTYIPGTVVHLGYGSVFRRLKWDENSYIPSDRFHERQRAFFLKLSYLWRL